jgi:hypothetical protein
MTSLPRCCCCWVVAVAVDHQAVVAYTGAACRRAVTGRVHAHYFEGSIFHMLHLRPLPVDNPYVRAPSGLNATSIWPDGAWVADM